MSKLMKELKSEVARLARKEIHAELLPVRKINAVQRRFIADLRRQVDALQKEVSALRKGAPAPENVAEQGESVPEGRSWITGKGIKALRKRLGLTQAALASLAGVSSPAVVQWEKKSGKIRLRKATATKLQEIRKMTKRTLAAGAESLPTA